MFKVTVKAFCPEYPSCCCCYSEEESVIWKGDNISDYINKDRGLIGKIENGCCNPNFRLYEFINDEWMEVKVGEKVD